MIPETDLRNIIANNLRRYRERLGVTQEEFADMAKVNRNQIGNIERAEINLTLRSLNKIANALDIEPYLLLIENSSE